MRVKPVALNTSFISLFTARCFGSNSEPSAGITACAFYFTNWWRWFAVS